MVKGNVVAGLTEEQYAEIELAVMESERGRNFLKEYLARNRSSDTHMLLEAISRLESALCLKAVEHEGGEQFTPALAEIAAVVTATRTEIAAIRNDLIAGGGALAQGPEAFSRAADQANQLSAELLSQVETVENVAWKLREMGVEAEICDKLDACVEELMSLCWRQDVSGQRAAKALSVLQFVNDRTGGNLVSMSDETGAQEALGAPAEETEPANMEKDAYFAQDAELFTSEAAPAEAPVAAPGFVYSETKSEDPLSTDAIVAEVSTDAPQHVALVEDEPEPEEPTPDNLSAAELIEKPAEMIGPQNLNGFTAMATSLDAKGPFTSTTLAEMVTPAPAEAPKEETKAEGAQDPFQVELENLAKKDGFAFKPDTKPEAEPEKAEDAKADGDDEDGNGHIVIIRTPAEPETDAERLPEPITQEKPAANGEVPMVEICSPKATGS
ncbi:MAG: hypothetical protein AAGF81_04565 [Pseudomonadota bacterium]